MPIEAQTSPFVCCWEGRCELPQQMEEVQTWPGALKIHPLPVDQKKLAKGLHLHKPLLPHPMKCDYCASPISRTSRSLFVSPPGTRLSCLSHSTQTCTFCLGAPHRGMSCFPWEHFVVVLVDQSLWSVLEKKGASDVDWSASKWSVSVIQLGDGLCTLWLIWHWCQYWSPQECNHFVLFYEKSVWQKFLCKGVCWKFEGNPRDSLPLGNYLERNGWIYQVWKTSIYQLLTEQTSTDCCWTHQYCL